MANEGSSNPLPATSVSTIPTIHLGTHLSAVLIVKLDEKNYLLLKAMILVVLRGQKRNKFVLGTIDQPTLKIPYVEKDTQIPNPAYESWMAIDQSILAWLYGSMSPSTTCNVLNLQKSKNVWKTLMVLQIRLV